MAQMMLSMEATCRVDPASEMRTVGSENIKRVQKEETKNE
jgi:hypothetical protein